MIEPFIAMLPQLIINGLIAGGLYALIAIGYTLIYGILKFINFAHGEVAMVGAYVSFIVVMLMGFDILIAFLVAMLFCAILGFAIEKIAYKPLRQSHRLAPLITAIAMSIFLQNLVALIFGNEVKSIRTTAITKGITLFKGTFGEQVIEVLITPNQINIIVTVVILMILLELFIKKTKVGKAIRATADNRTLADTIGIDSNKVISATFAIGSALAAAAGILIALEQNLEPTMGLLPGIKAFTAAVVGGIGSIPGAVLGAMLIGLSENIGIWFLPSGYKDAIAFVILIIFLLFRPKGILGGKKEEDIRK